MNGEVEVSLGASTNECKIEIPGARFEEHAHTRTHARARADTRAHAHAHSTDTRVTASGSSPRASDERVTAFFFFLKAQLARHSA